MPNSVIDPNLSLQQFIVPIEALEAAAGVQFYPEYLSGSTREHYLIREEKQTKMKNSPFLIGDGKGGEKKVSKTVDDSMSAPSHLCAVEACELVKKEWTE